MNDTMVEAIAISSPSGRMSKRARKAALARLAAKLFPREEQKPVIQTIVNEAREQMNPHLDNFEIGQLVIARFTNSGRVLEFKGRIIGKTKNYWKVESITAPYPTEQPGRMFRIATLRGREYSANNCIVRITD